MGEVPGKEVAMPGSEEHERETRTTVNRRRVLSYFGALGLGGTLLPGALLAVAQDAPEITPEMVAAAARIAGLPLSPEAGKAVAEGLRRRGGLLQDFQDLRDMGLGNDTPSALVFDPVLPGTAPPSGRSYLRTTKVRVAAPRSDEDLAFLPVTHLAALLKRREIRSVDLTRICLERLKKYDPLLHCVVTLTEDLALEQAARADREIAAGRYRGPLHGVPWGAKDLLAVKGYKTTFGASPYRDQTIDRNATVTERLTAAGAVLVAKLSLGALAMGDRWFGGQTKSPWDPKNPRQGSSGSSAGPAAAVAAGLVPFAVGSETRGSIISPASRCGVTGLRPSFGRVSRFGAMALSWTMDKLGPLCRTAEDCAVVLHAIQGPDGRDNTVLDVPFGWDAGRDVRKLRVGYLKSDLERDIPDDPRNPDRVLRMREGQAFGRASLEVIRKLGLDPVAVELPKMGSGPLDFLLTTEAAAAFDDLVRSDRLDLMAAEPERSAWVGSLRLHEFVPAVQYIQANRARYRLMEAYHEFFRGMDVLVGSALGPTNLTGHPELALPQGFDSKGQPSALRLTGRLFGDADVLLLAHAFQGATEFHLRRPKLD
jgi:Asp-tRNA(Asn)/Glu-tRNA(Gln) amidotransferase A subunit family amidase